MTAATRAKQIAALADQVVPLGKKARGMPLAADDWNQIVSIVSALLKIDQEQDDDTGSRLDSAYARADHQHLGQVTLEWLDAGLQSRLADGESSISTRQMLAAMQKTVDGLREEVSRLTALVTSQQTVIDAATSDEIDRKRQLAIVETRFASIDDLRVTVGGIAKSQTALDKNVKAVLDLRGKLTDAAGTPIDLSALAGHVSELQGLRDSLTGVDGKPLRLKDLQVQLIDLSDQIPRAGGVSAPVFDAQFAAATANLETKLTKDSQTRIETLRGELLAADDKVANTLTAKIDLGLTTSRDATLEATTGLVKAAEGRLGASVTDQVTATRKTLSASLRDQADAAVSAGLATVDTRIGSAVDQRVNLLGTKLATDLDVSVSGKVDQRIATTATSLGSRLAAVETNMTAISAAIPEQVDKRVTTATAALQVRFDTQADARAAALQESLVPIIDQRVNTGLDTGLIKIRGAASQTVADALGDLDARIATSVTSATRTLPDQVAAQVKTQITQANIPGQITAANTATTAQLRTEIAASAANVTLVNNTAMTSAITNLRGEMGSAAVTRVASPIAGGISSPLATPTGPTVRNPRNPG